MEDEPRLEEPRMEAPRMEEDELRSSRAELQSTRLVFGVHCLKIRHKGMYVNYEQNPDPDYYNEMFNSGSYWCGQTQTSFGPDGQPVRPDICQGGRDCCAL